MTSRLNFRDLHVRADGCHAARTLLRGPVSTLRHFHDFLEVFYVTSGSGMHHVNRAELPLSPGDVCLVRAKDAHQFSTPAGGSVEFINIAFSAAWWRAFTGLLPLDADARRWLCTRQPMQTRVSLARRQDLCTRFEALLGGATELGPVEVCTGVLRALLHRSLAATDERLPAWLDKAAARLHEPRFRQLGVHEFYRLAGRSPEHVARTCRKFFATTPTHLINRARIDRVKTQLLTGDEKITTLAFENGFENLGYFYRIFRRFAGCSPQQWRQKHGTAGVVPP